MLQWSKRSIGTESYPRWSSRHRKQQWSMRPRWRRSCTVQSGEHHISRATNEWVAKKRDFRSILWLQLNGVYVAYPLGRRLPTKGSLVGRGARDRNQEWVVVTVGCIPIRSSLTNRVPSSIECPWQNRLDRVATHLTPVPQAHYDAQSRLIATKQEFERAES